MQQRGTWFEVDRKAGVLGIRIGHDLVHSATDHQPRASDRKGAAIGMPIGPLVAGPFWYPVDHGGRSTRLTQTEIAFLRPTTHSKLISPRTLDVQMPIAVTPYTDPDLLLLVDENVRPFTCRQHGRVLRIATDRDSLDLVREGLDFFPPRSQVRFHLAGDVGMLVDDV